MFHPELAVFLCNKWEQVPKHEDEIVWKNIKRKILSSWMNLQENQVIKFSVNKENRLRKNGLPKSDEFQTFLNFLQTMIPATLKGKMMIHTIWMENFLKLVQHATATKINVSRKTKEEKITLHNILESRLKQLTKRSKQIKQELIKFLTSRQDEIATKLFNHLNEKKCKERLSTWAESECPSSETIAPVLFGVFTKDMLKKTREVATEKIISRLENEIFNWSQENDFISKLQKEFSEQLKEKLQILDDKVRELHDEMTGFSLSGRSNNHSNSHDLSWFKIPALLVGSLFLGAFGLFFPTIFIALPIAAVIINVFHFSYLNEIINCKEKYSYKKQKYMTKWTIEHLDSLNESTLRLLLDDIYFKDAKKQVKLFFDENIPQIIETDRKIIKKSISDQSEAEIILSLHEPFQKKVDECQRKVLLFNQIYLSDKFIKESKIRQREKIVQGTQTIVYKAELSLDGNWIPVAVKRSRCPLDNDISFLQLQHMETLFNFDHPNVLKTYGASVSHNGKEKVLETITELCEETLKNMLDRTSCSLLTPGTEEFTYTFKVFMNIAIEIAEGLEHIHSRGFVHLNLKLEKILIQKDCVKIDAGFSKSKELSGSTHISTEENIYHFGVIIWQMWYQKGISHEKYNSKQDVQSVLEKGERPCVYKDLDSFPSLKKLMESCLNDNPAQRLNITEVKETLKRILNKLSVV